MKALFRSVISSVLLAAPVFAQLPPGFVHPNLSDRLTNENAVAVQIFGSWVKMIGDSVDHSTVDPWAGIMVYYGASDRFSIAFETGFGWVRARRDGASSFASTSAFPFKTNLVPALVHGIYYLRDYEWLIMPFVEGMAGVIYWDARDLRTGSSTTFANGTSVRSSVSPAVGFGAGVDYFTSPKFALTTSARWIRMFTDGMETSGLTALGTHNGDRNSGILELKIGAKIILQSRTRKRKRSADGFASRGKSGGQIMYSKEDDSDNDRVSDFHEMYHYKTDPNNRDSDRDGLPDGAEIWKYRTNPNKKDSDGDGVSDGKEVLVLKTNPLRKDAGAKKAVPARQRTTSR